ncbi:MAG: Lrp/AsnC ligand binding domain-containing protein [Chloroflexi bacterium]|nr:Lrp/AsnC ligand binding domain-containing protein [Chloroflexota bacterium]
MAERAYVLITVETPQTQQVIDRLRQIPGAVGVHEVIGPYDVVVEMEADTYEDLTMALRNHIRPIQGIRTTVTCPWM